MTDDDLTTAYILGVEHIRDKMHKQADEIERLRAENEKFDDTRIEYICMINKLVDEINALRKEISRLNSTIYEDRRVLADFVTKFFKDTKTVLDPKLAINGGKRAKK